jgi:hypothetical protein
MGILWTLRARGLVPSLGAGGSLIVAGLCCLLFATALLTFRDWPGRGETAPGGTITMSPPAAKAVGRVASGPVAPAAVAAAPARERARGTRPARRGRPRRGSAAPQVPAGTNSPTTPAPALAPAAAPRPAATQPAAAAPHAPAPSRPQGPVETTVQIGRETVSPLPPVVAEPVQPVLDTVQAVGRTVDETAGPLLPTLP